MTWLKAVNGPLQQRTTVLDLDLSRSNTFPADYDTDIESEWSNPSKYTFINTIIEKYTFHFRSLCWWKWFVIWCNTKRSKWILSKTISYSTDQSNEWDSLFIIFIIEYSFEYWTKFEHQYTKCLYVIGNRFSRSIIE